MSSNELPRAFGYMVVVSSVYKPRRLRLFGVEVENLGFKRTEVYRPRLDVVDCNDIDH